jgi:hypothetical protein
MYTMSRDDEATRPINVRDYDPSNDGAPSLVSLSDSDGSGENVHVSEDMMDRVRIAHTYEERYDVLMNEFQDRRRVLTCDDVPDFGELMRLAPNVEIQVFLLHKIIVAASPGLLVHMWTHGSIVDVILCWLACLVGRRGNEYHNTYMKLQLMWIMYNVVEEGDTVRIHRLCAQYNVAAVLRNIMTIERTRHNRIQHVYSLIIIFALRVAIRWGIMEQVVTIRTRTREDTTTIPR